MGLGKQAKVLNAKQVEALLHHVGNLRHGVRNRVIVLLSVRAGLRAKEIAALRWSMVLDAGGNVGDSIHLTNDASKGRSGRIVPLNRELRPLLIELYSQFVPLPPVESSVVSSERAASMSAQAVVNMFRHWYRDLGLIGCSSHSGRRTFITNAARKISTVGGSLRDVQSLAGHASLQTTQNYIDGVNQARKRVVDLI